MISPFFAMPFRRFFTAVAVACMPLVLGGWIHGPQSTFEPKGPVAAEQLQVFYVTVWVSLAIFVVVAAVLAYAIIKFKAKAGDDRLATPPAQSHGNPLIELSLIGASVFALVIIAIPSLRAIWYTFDVPEAEKANVYEVTATGYQWWFKFEYTQEKADKGANLLTANELVIPAGRPIRINLRTNDVIHSFWVPKLAGKVDMIPNRGNHIWMQADEPGYFWGQCAEFCGLDHAVMRFRVIALEQKQFDAWLAAQKLPAHTAKAVAAAPTDRPTAQFASYKFEPKIRNSPGYSEAFDADPLGSWMKHQFSDGTEDAALVARGRLLFQQKTCVTCHMVRGHEGAGTVAPDLTHVGSRSTIAGGVLENNSQNLHRWITNPDNVKPGNKMWEGVGPMAGYMRRVGDNWVRNITVSDDEAYALVAYLESLKLDAPAKP